MCDVSAASCLIVNLDVDLFARVNSIGRVMCHVSARVLVTILFHEAILAQNVYLCQIRCTMKTMCGNEVVQC